MSLIINCLVIFLASMVIPFYFVSSVMGTKYRILGLGRCWWDALLTDPLNLLGRVIIKRLKKRVNEVLLDVQVEPQNQIRYLPSRDPEGSKELGFTL